MSVTTSNLIQGAGTLYSAAFGATEPADTAVATAPSSGTWTDVGGTQDGVNVTVKQEYAELAVDQLVDTPERRLTKREYTVTTNLAEPTLANLTLALNSNVTSASSGTGATANTALTAGTVAPGVGPTYAALIFDGFGPNGKRRRFIGRKMLQTGDIGQGYTKDKQTVLSVSFVSHYVSSSIAPTKFVEDTST